MSASRAEGAALDASVLLEEPAPLRTPAQQDYLDAIAAEAESAVQAVEATIADLQASLADRKTEAQLARDEADRGRI